MNQRKAGLTAYAPSFARRVGIPISQRVRMVRKAVAVNDQEIVGAVGRPNPPLEGCFEKATGAPLMR